MHMVTGGFRSGYHAFCRADGPSEYCAIGDDVVDCGPCLAEAKRRFAMPDGQRMAAAGWPLSAAYLVRAERL